MPARNSRKQYIEYIENSYYHLYNRGVEKRRIFLDQQDYVVFLSYLQDYLLPKDNNELRKKLQDPNLSYKEKGKIAKLLRLNNFSDHIDLLAFCLMPNHFHFFIKQKLAQMIDYLMNSLGTRYTMYFNKKYKRVGSLYQGVYKAVPVVSDEQFVYLSKYIHKQALASQGEALRTQPSSYMDFLGQSKTPWVKPEEVLAHFSLSNPLLSYKSFVEESDAFGNIRNIVIEED